MITWTCVLKSGGWPKAVHVEKLQRQLGVPLVCLSDLDLRIDGVTVLPLVSGLPKWWAKMELYRPGLLTGRCLYVDLDSLILRQLDELVALDDPAAFHEDGLMKGTVSTAVMAWDAELLWPCWDVFMADPDLGMSWDFYGQRRIPNTVLSDQTAVEECMRRLEIPFTLLERKLPGYVAQSRDWLASPPPPSAAVLTCCGLDKPQECGGWIQERWEAL